MRRSLILFLLFALPAAAEIAVSEVRIGPAPIFGFSPPGVSIADGDEVSLVLWRVTVSANGANVSARVVGSDGAPRGRVQIPLGLATSAQAVWNGRDFLVVLAPAVSRFGSIIDVPTIATVHVSADGRVLEETRRVLRRGREAARVTSVAWNGESYLVGTGAEVVLVDRNDSVVRTTPLPFAPHAIVNRGDAFLVAGVKDLQALHLARVSRRGDLESSSAIATGTLVFGATLAASDDSAAIVWRDDFRLYATVVAGETVTTRELANGNSLTAHSAAWTGSDYRAAWGGCVVRFDAARVITEECRLGPRAVAGRRIVAAEEFDWVYAGLRLSALNLLSEVALLQSAPAAVELEDGHLVAFVESRTELRIARIDADGRRVFDRPLASLPSITSVRAARAGGQLLVVFAGDDREILGMRVGLDGQPIGELLKIGRGSVPDVASDGTGWLVAWEDDAATPQMRVTAIGANGTIAEPTGTIVTPNGSAQLAPDVTWDGEHYVAAYLEAGQFSDGPHWRVLVQRLDANGTPVEPPQTLVDTPHRLERARIACGATCLVTWLEEPRLRAVRLGTATIVTPAVPPIANSEMRLAALPDGTFALGATGSRLFRIRLDADANVLAVNTITASNATIGEVLPRASIYVRTTLPQEDLGNAPRVFLLYGDRSRRRAAR
ncbi:MAG TPA: hypothetical protein VF698_08375 [Thermoanaerobaculia bacterium]